MGLSRKLTWKAAVFLLQGYALGHSLDSTAVVPVGPTSQHISEMAGGTAVFFYRNDQPTPLVFQGQSSSLGNCRADLPAPPVLPETETKIIQATSHGLIVRCENLPAGHFNRTITITTNQGPLVFRVFGTARQAAPRPLSTRLLQAQDECFNRNWVQEKCTYISVKTDPELAKTYRVRWWDWANRNGNYLLVDALNIGKAMSAPFTCGEPSARNTLVDQLEAKIEQAANKHGMTDCGRACLSKCLSAKLIDYDDRSSGNAALNAAYWMNSRTSDILIEGRGQCVNFAHLNHEFNLKLGIDSQWAFHNQGNGSVHSFTRVKIGKEWYSSEPQDPSCVFLRD